MQKILHNLAMIDLLNFCKEQGIDPSGSHVVKAKRGFTYSLISDATGKVIASVAFKASSIPQHFINSNQ